MTWIHWHRHEQARQSHQRTIKALTKTVTSFQKITRIVSRKRFSQRKLDWLAPKQTFWPPLWFLIRLKSQILMFLCRGLLQHFPQIEIHASWPSSRGKERRRRKKEKNHSKSVTGSLWSTDAAGEVLNERPVEVECAAETETGPLFQYHLHLGTKSFSRRVGRGKTNLHGIPYGWLLHQSTPVDVSCSCKPTLNAFQSDWACKSYETTHRCLDMSLWCFCQFCL